MRSPAVACLVAREPALPEVAVQRACTRSWRRGNADNGSAGATGLACRGPVLEGRTTNTTQEPHSPGDECVPSPKDRDARKARKATRGGQGSRAKRLQKFQEAQAKCVVKWWPLVQGVLRQHRATLRDDARMAWTRLQAARSKIRDALWRAWTCRSLKIVGPHDSLQCDEYTEYVLCPIRGKALEPLSHRDMWVLKRAAALALRVPKLTRHDPDPDFDRQTRRHICDWLHVAFIEDGVSYPHCCHTHPELAYSDDSEFESEHSSD